MWIIEKNAYCYKLFHQNKTKKIIDGGNIGNFKSASTYQGVSKCYNIINETREAE